MAESDTAALQPAPRAATTLRTVGRVAREDWARLRAEMRSLDKARVAKGALRWTASLFAVLAAAVVLLAAFFDWNHLRGPLGRYASDRLDREVRISGDLDVELFGWTPRITAEGITVGQPPWGPDGPMARVSRLTAEVELMPLLRGAVRLPLLAIEAPVMDLRRDGSGRANWDFGKPDEADGPTRLPPIRRFIINDGRLAFDDRKRGLTFSGTVSTSERQGESSDSAFRLRGEGRLNGEDFRLTVTGGPLVNVRPDQPYPFDAEVRAGSTRVVGRGAIAEPFDLGAFSMTLTASGPDLADVYDLTNIPLPNTPPYRLSARLTRDDTLYRIRGLSGRVGDSDLGGSLTVDRSGDRPRLTADLVSRSLDFDDLNTVLGGPPDPAETASAEQKAMAGRMRARSRLLPEATLDLERVRGMDAELRYRATSVKASALPLREARLDMTLERGLLEMNPVSFRFPQGELSAVVQIDGRGRVPVTTADIRVRGVRAENFIPARGGRSPLEGTVHARARLRGAGASIHAAASNADGNVTIVMPNGRMRQAFAELLGINAGRGLLLLLGKDQGETPVRCAVGDFVVQDGVMRSRRIVIDTGVVLANGSGTVDLETEAMNLVIDGETKQPRLLRVWSPITVQGPIQEPRFGVKGGQVAAQGGLAAALAVLVTPIAALLPFVDPGLADDADCGALIAAAGRTGSAVTAARSAR